MSKKKVENENFINNFKIEKIFCRDLQPFFECFFKSYLNLENEEQIAEDEEYIKQIFNQKYFGDKK